MAQQKNKNYHYKKNKKLSSNNIQETITENKEQKNKFVPYIFIAILAFVIYGNSLFNNYALDDTIVITQNKFTQEGISGIPDILKYDTFTGFWYSNDTTKTPQQIQEEKKLVPGGRYRPLSLISFAIENSIFGKDMIDEGSQKSFIGCPFVNHLVNILLYIITVFILYKVLLMLFPNNEQKWYFSFSYIVSILFLFHPIHTEAVANIKGRDEIMTLLFSLVALLFTIYYHKNNKKYYLLFSGLFLFLGLLSKENTITFLAVIPITIYLFVTKKIKNILISLLPLIVAAGLFLIIRSSVLGFSHNEQIADELMNNPFLRANFNEKYATIFVTLLIYIKLLIIPYPLTYDYYPKQIEIVDFSSPVALLSLFLYIAILVIAIYGLFRKKESTTWKIISFAIFFYLIPLSVVSNIFFGVGTFMNERFIFISSIGFCIIIAFILNKLITKIIKNIKTRQTVTVFFLTLILIGYGYQTISRNSAWKDDYTLFVTDVKTSSKSAKSNCSAGGKSLEKAKLIKNDQIKHDKLCEQSIKYLTKAVEIHPNYSDAWLLLGNAYYEYNYNIPKALDSYANVIRRDINANSLALNNAKIVANACNGLLTENKTKASYSDIIKSCDNLLKIKSNITELIYLKAVIYGKYLNDINNSLLLFKEVENSKNFEKTANFYKDIGVAYGIAKEYEKALHYLLLAIEKDSNDPQTYFNIGTTYNILGDTNNANKYTELGNQKKQAEEQKK